MFVQADLQSGDFWRQVDCYAGFVSHFTQLLQFMHSGAVLISKWRQTLASFLDRMNAIANGSGTTSSSSSSAAQADTPLPLGMPATDVLRVLANVRAIADSPQYVLLHVIELLDPSTLPPSAGTLPSWLSQFATKYLRFYEDQDSVTAFINAITQWYTNKEYVIRAGHPTYNAPAEWWDSFVGSGDFAPLRPFALALLSGPVSSYPAREIFTAVRRFNAPILASIGGQASLHAISGLARVACYRHYAASSPFVTTFQLGATPHRWYHSHLSDQSSRTTDETVLDPAELDVDEDTFECTWRPTVVTTVPYTHATVSAQDSVLDGMTLPLTSGSGGTASI